MDITLAMDGTGLLLLAAAMLAAGLLAGFVAGLLGVGGGIVVVPVLFQAFTMLDVDPAVRMHLAVGTSLATIIPTGLRSARAHQRRGAVDMELLRAWGVPVLLGVLLGSALSSVVGGDVLSGVFAVVALVVAVQMAVFGPQAKLADQLPGQPAKSLMAGVIGTISAMMGIGGGTLSVPILSLFNYPIRYAVGTASAIGLIIAVPGTAGFVIAGWGAAGLPPLSVGYVNLLAFAVIVPTTILTAPLGAKAAHTIPQRALRLSFAAFLFITSLRMFYGIAAS
ncbi:sulfite exporter TauE/SafE family protein [Ferruginivarius sediminum]|uniref:Probable membrane transporter protein n=2 Tax=Ferruginivarius sediminum TaxID=2661937 RepID=A0A369TF01_9PROT|nr:sulfite exporter TauE/SafE family protein [Ferruginivarius sediminum]